MRGCHLLVGTDIIAVETYLKFYVEAVRRQKLYFRNETNHEVLKEKTWLCLSSQVYEFILHKNTVTLNAQCALKSDFQNPLKISDK